jgi:hypothetical protein
MAAWAGPGDDTDEEIRLCRMEYLGDDDRGFALYDPATDLRARGPARRLALRQRRRGLRHRRHRSPHRIRGVTKTARRAPVRDHCAAALVAGDKSGQWRKWYRTAIPRTKRLYDYLAICLDQRAWAAFCARRSRCSGVMSRPQGLHAEAEVGRHGQCSSSQGTGGAFVQLSGSRRLLRARRYFEVRAVTPPPKPRPTPPAVPPTPPPTPPTSTPGLSCSGWGWGSPGRCR